MPTLAAVVRCIHDHFSSRKNRQRVRRITTGPAAERWFTAEGRVALNWAKPAVLGNNQYVNSEQAVFGRRLPDMTIFRTAVPTDRTDVCCIVEAKAVYPDTEKHILKKMRELRTQLNRHRAMAKAAGATPSVFGLLFVVWQEHTAKHHKPYMMDYRFNIFVRNLARDTFANMTQFDWWEQLEPTTVLKRKCVVLGPWNTHTAVSLIAVRRRA